MVEIPKHTSKLSEIVKFYLHSSNFRNLSAKSQKDYEKHLDVILKTNVEGRLLGNYTVRSIKARHTNLAYEKWLKSGVRTANYRKAVLSTAWKYSMRRDVMDNDPVRLIKRRILSHAKSSGLVTRLCLFLTQHTATSSGVALG